MIFLLTGKSSDVHFLQVLGLQDDNCQFTSRRDIAEREADVAQLVFLHFSNREINNIMKKNWIGWFGWRIERQTEWERQRDRVRERERERVCVTKWNQNKIVSIIKYDPNWSHFDDQLVWCLWMYSNRRNRDPHHSGCK